MATGIWHRNAIHVAIFDVDDGDGRWLRTLSFLIRQRGHRLLRRSCEGRGGVLALPRNFRLPHGALSVWRGNHTSYFAAKWVVIDGSHGPAHSMRLLHSIITKGRRLSILIFVGLSSFLGAGGPSLLH